ncbi:oxidoreductase [Suillus subaureus]|uniref:Oxidoreductase n=1 Tax=Suillus subaureus TaxID=48587 RepID=A0A9P7EHM0_9AGAM|nr:oxidoreductase [Suillus subaureus]KAG1822049.1 oxidoreductase [Suillus subaureus]
MFDWISLASKALLLLILIYSSSFMFSSKKWSPKGLHVYITGGSQGLGLGLAKLLARKGAHVSIVARNQTKLDNALKELEANRQSPDQVFKAFSFSLNTAEGSAAALQAASDAHGGQVPDAVFTCAGTAKPMYFLEMQPEDLSRGMENGFWIQAWTAFAAAKQMVRENKKGGKIVLVSSTLGYMSLIGYSSYSPPKHALRGLGDSLHSELMLYGIDTHIFFPPTMYTPGFEEENKTKPVITKAIEAADEGLTPDQAAAGLFSGVEKGQAHITADFITSVFRASTRGCAPRSNGALDFVLDLIALVGIPFWRRSVDKQVLAHRAEHREYLRSKGLVD